MTSIVADRSTPARMLIACALSCTVSACIPQSVSPSIEYPGAVTNDIHDPAAMRATLDRLLPAYPHSADAARLLKAEGFEVSSAKDVTTDITDSTDAANFTSVTRQHVTYVYGYRRQGGPFVFDQWRVMFVIDPTTDLVTETHVFLSLIST